MKVRRILPLPPVVIEKKVETLQKLIHNSFNNRCLPPMLLDGERHSKTPGLNFTFLFSLIRTRRFFPLREKIILAWNAKFPRLIRKYTRKLFTSFVLTRQKETPAVKKNRKKRHRKEKFLSFTLFCLLRQLKKCPLCLLCFLNYHHHHQNNNITKQSRFVLCKSDRGNILEERTGGGMNGKRQHQAKS